MQDDSSERGHNELVWSLVNASPSDESIEEIAQRARAALFRHDERSSWGSAPSADTAATPRVAPRGGASSRFWAAGLVQLVGRCVVIGEDERLGTGVMFWVCAPGHDRLVEVAAASFADAVLSEETP